MMLPLMFKIGIDKAKKPRNGFKNGAALEAIAELIQSFLI